MKTNDNKRHFETTPMFAKGNDNQREDENVGDHDKTNDNKRHFEITPMFAKGNDNQREDEHVGDHELQPFKIDDTNTSEQSLDMTVKQIWVNVIMLSLSFLLMFAAFLSFLNLQSTVNQVEGLGTVGIAAIFISMVVTTMFLPPLVMSRFSLKWIAVFSMATHLGYIATGYYPSWYTIIPASIIVGIGSAHLWIVNSAFITQLARRYAALKDKNAKDVISHFFGVFFVAMCSNNIWGNLISSLVLQVDQLNSSNGVDNTTRCGAEFCSHDHSNNTVLIQPTRQQYYLFTSMCMALGLVAIACLVLFMKYIPPERRHGRVDIAGNLKNVLTHLLTDHRQHLLILPTLYRGMIQAFISGDYTIAFVSCTLGVDTVGFVMMTFGTTAAVLSYVISQVSKHTGLYPLFCVAFVTHAAVSIAMVLWTPNSSQPSVIYVLAGLWSVGDAAYQSLVTVIYSVYFEDRLETALSCFRLLDSLGLAVTFSYSAFLCTRYKLHIVQAFLLASHICITVFFLRMRKTKPDTEGESESPVST